MPQEKLKKEQGTSILQSQHFEGIFCPVQSKTQHKKKSFVSSPKAHSFDQVPTFCRLVTLYPSTFKLKLELSQCFSAWPIPDSVDPNFLHSVLFVRIKPERVFLGLGPRLKILNPRMPWRVHVHEVTFARDLFSGKRLLAWSAFVIPPYQWTQSLSLWNRRQDNKLSSPVSDIKGDIHNPQFGLWVNNIMTYPELPVGKVDCDWPVSGWNARGGHRGEDEGPIDVGSSTPKMSFLNFRFQNLARDLHK